MRNKRDTGARVDQGGKKKWLDLLNEIQKKYKYTVENTNTLNQSAISVILEFIMRNYSSNNIHKTIMFLSSEEYFYLSQMN